MDLKLEEAYQPENHSPVHMYVPNEVGLGTDGRIPVNNLER